MILSIIIPTYNRAALIKYTLDSLAEQHHSGIAYEVIVVDDGSDDDTEAVIRQHYPTVRLYKNKKKGAAAARNMGLELARGKYIMYLDSDDLVGENYFAEKIAFLEGNSGYNAVYGEYDFFVADGAFSKEQVIFKYKYPLLMGKTVARDHLFNYLGGNFTPPHSIIWERSFLQKINGHTESLAINQDVELFIRAIFMGLTIAAIADGTKVYVRSHALDSRVGDPRSGANKWLQILELRKKIYDELKVYAYDAPEFYEALSNYLFNYWRMLRHSEPQIAAQYLNFAKQVYWPVKIQGNTGFRLLSVVLGPVRAVQMKYFLLKRD